MAFYLLAGITFLSAFLLFQIELIIAKLFLPSYGGSYLVWGACVVFFQGILLLGYVFAHQLIAQKGIASYLKIHLVLLLIPLLFFPGRMLHIPHAGSSLSLVIDIFVKLLFTIGPVFFVLSTVSLVTQSWCVALKKYSNNPYALYAVSNLGSFLGLLTYPFCFEINLTNTAQLYIWRFLYLLLVCLSFIALKRIPVEIDSKETKTYSMPDWKIVCKWLSLSASGVILFLSVTNIITYEVTPAPLLWIIPLSIYLLSFVLNFKSKPFMPLWISRFIFYIIGAAITYYFLSKMLMMPVVFSTVIFDVLLFLLCMFIQGQLVRSKPENQNLTFFYVMISVGGFIGGILTSWIIPLISINLIEFLVGLLLLAVGTGRKWLVGISVVSIFLSSPIENFIRNHDSLIRKRNYYGVYDIFEKKDLRVFVHGTTLHGAQLTDPASKWIPIGYYSPTSPLGDVLTKNLFHIRHIGGIGLGAGTIAMYSRTDCSVDFYELDPDVVTLAKNYFTYLSLAPGQVNIILGDARISLEKQKGVLYDILVVDAFGGDSIPTHLINKDVATIYKQYLNEGGAVLFHIPNRYFDLKPILAHIAKDLGGFAAYKTAANDKLTLQTVWGIITWDQQKYLSLVSTHGWQALDAKDYPNIRSWDDNYSTILPIIRWEQLKDSFQFFNHMNR